MAGITNSWIEQYTVQPTPCINTDNQSGSTAACDFSLSNCIVWAIVGLVIGSITFSKKGSNQ